MKRCPDETVEIFQPFVLRALTLYRQATLQKMLRFDG
jgi:hypothetical protein